MRGIEGNFMAQPRVFAHSALPVTPSNSGTIDGTSDRGCALYIGSTGNLAVRMEGTHKAVDINGNEYETNVNVFKNVPGSSFLPILVVQVLDSSVVELQERAQYYDSELNRWEDIADSLQGQLALLTKQLADLDQQIDEAQVITEKICDNQGEDSGACSIARNNLDNLLSDKETLEQEKEKTENELDEAVANVSQYQDWLDTIEDQIASGEGIVDTDASDILALF